MTEWDKFHREDIALTRAIAANSLAEEMYAICGMMDTMFGLGDGRLLLRAAAAATQSSVRSGRLPGMTRKAVQLCSEPGSLVHNFRSYAAGLHLREAWRAAGHDQRAAKLVDAGRRLTSAQLIAFTLLFRDVMGRAVRPWVQITQSNRTEPWAVQRHWVAHERAMEGCLAACRSLRHILRLLTLLRQWLPVSDLNALAAALFYARPRDVFLDGAPAGGLALGKVFPAFMLGLGPLLHNDPPRFQGVELLCIPPAWQAGYRLLGPHCQCMFLQRNGVPHGHVQLKRGTGTRRVRVPIWVAGAQRQASAAQDVPVEEDVDRGYALAPIRFQWRPAEQLTVPLGVSPEGRYRPRIQLQGRGSEQTYRSSCMLPPSLPQIFAELDSSLSAAGKFVQDALSEERKVFGAEGSSAAMSRVIGAMARCFDWGRLVDSCPCKEDLEAWATLCGLLRPYLRLTEWPDAAEFPDVPHGWPAEEELVLQYVVLMSRLRHARQRRPAVARGWWKITRYRVAPVISSSQVISLAGLFLYRAAGAPTSGEPARQFVTLVCRIAGVLSDLLTAEEKRRIMASARAPDPDDPNAREAARAPRDIIVSSSMLARTGVKWRGKVQPARLQAAAREQFGIRAAEPGGLAVLLLPGVVGKLVHIEAVEKELDWSAVSASVDSDPYFSRGAVDARGAGRRHRRPRNAWHAVRTHHHCRLLGVPEAACERVGSIMKHQWQKNPRASVSALMDATMLSAARVTCTGVARDEALCQIGRAHV